MKASYVVCGFAAALIAQIAHSEDGPTQSSLTYTELRQQIDAGNVTVAYILNNGQSVSGELKNGVFFVTNITPETPIADRLADAGVQASFMPTKEDLPLWLSVTFNILPFLIFLAFFFFVVRSMRKSSDGQGGYYARAEKLNREFLDRLERLLLEMKNDV